MRRSCGLVKICSAGPVSISTSIRKKAASSARRAVCCTWCGAIALVEHSLPAGSGRLLSLVVASSRWLCSSSPGHHNLLLTGCSPALHLSKRAAGCRRCAPTLNKGLISPSSGCGTIRLRARGHAERTADQGCPFRFFRRSAWSFWSPTAVCGVCGMAGAGASGAGGDAHCSASADHAWSCSGGWLRSLHPIPRLTYA